MDHHAAAVQLDCSGSGPCSTGAVAMWDAVTTSSLQNLMQVCKLKGREGLNDACAMHYTICIWLLHWAINMLTIMAGIFGGNIYILADCPNYGI